MSLLEKVVGGRVTVAYLTNGSGAARSAGEVVARLDTSDNSFTLPTGQGATTVLGVVLDPQIPAGQAGRVVLVGGPVTVKVTGAVSRGNYLRHSATAGVAEAVASYGVGVFAVATTAWAGPGAGTVEAVLFPVDKGAAGAPTDAPYILRTADSRLPAAVVHANLTGADLHPPGPHASQHASGGSDVLYEDVALTVFVPGDLTVKTTAGNVRLYSPYTFTIEEVHIAVNTAPAGQAIIVDVNKGGVTIFTNQANRPQILAGANTGTSGTPDVTAVAKNDLITVDIDQVGTTTAGADLVVQIRGRKAVRSS